MQVLLCTSFPQFAPCSQSELTLSTNGTNPPLGNGASFKNGRDAAACLGLTPVQHSSGGKQKIGSISQAGGHKRLRSLLIMGAISVLSYLEKQEPKNAKENWLKALMQRRGKRIAAVALANKTIRTAWAMLSRGEDYKPSLQTV